MGIIAKLKSVLGVGRDGRDRRDDRRTTVAVEREPTADAPAEAETTAEPAATGERAVKGVEEPSDVEELSDDQAPDEDGEPVDSIKGIGSAYAGRLEEAGVHTVSDLARADAEELAAATDLGAGRVGNWIERAKARVE